MNYQWNNYQLSRRNLLRHDPDSDDKYVIDLFVVAFPFFEGLVEDPVLFFHRLGPDVPQQLPEFPVPRTVSSRGGISGIYVNRVFNGNFGLET
jgi:hypothetical protein